MLAPAAASSGAVPDVGKPHFIDAAIEIAQRMLKDPVAVDMKTQHALRTEKKDEAAAKRKSKASSSAAAQSKSGKNDAKKRKVTDCNVADGAPVGAGSAASSGGAPEAIPHDRANPWVVMHALYGDVLEQLPPDAQPVESDVKGVHSYTVTKTGFAGRCSALCAPHLAFW